MQAERKEKKSAISFASDGSINFNYILTKKDDFKKMVSGLKDMTLSRLKLVDTECGKIEKEKIYCFHLFCIRMDEWTMEIDIKYGIFCD